VSPLFFFEPQKPSLYIFSFIPGYDINKPVGAYKQRIGYQTENGG
jgi:hypothetical protein